MIIKQHGGTDAGNEWYIIKYFPDHDLYIRLNGNYSSYDGVFFNNYNCGYAIVVPVEKTITEYEERK